MTAKPPVTDAAETEPVSTELTAAEKAEVLAEARRIARKRIKDEVVAAEKKMALEQALYEERLAAGLIEPEPNEDMVEVTIDVAPFAAINHAVTGVRINGMSYVHGSRYTVKRSVANTLLDICHKTWKHQREIEGREEYFYRERGASIGTSTGDGKGRPVVQGMKDLSRFAA